MPATLSNSYTSISGGLFTDQASVVVASGEKIVIGVTLDSGAVDDIDWGADLAEGTLITGSIVSNAGVGTVELWEINNPTPGTRTLRVNYDTTGTVRVHVWVFAGAGACSDVVTQNTDDSTTPHTVTVPNTTADDFLVDLLFTSGNVIIGTNQTVLIDDTTVNSSSKDGSLSATGVMEWTSGPNRDVAGVACRVPEAGGGGQSIAFNQVTETDSAQTFTATPGALTQAFSQALETATAATFGALLTTSLAFGQVTETDTAQTFANLTGQITAFNQVTETDTAQTIAPIPSAGQFHYIFTAAYADLPANSVAKEAGLTDIVIGDGYQIDLLTTPDGHALTGDGEMVITVGGVLTRAQTATYTIYDASTGDVGTSDTLTIEPGTSTISLGQVSETDSAQAFSFQTAIVSTFNQVTETDSAGLYSIPGTVAISFNAVAETDSASAYASSGAITIAFNQVTETDSASQLLSPLSVLVSYGQVLETDTAQPIATPTLFPNPIGRIAIVTAESRIAIVTREPR